MVTNKELEMVNKLGKIALSLLLAGVLGCDEERTSGKNLESMTKTISTVQKVERQASEEHMVEKQKAEEQIAYKKDLYDMIERHEGKRNSMYIDTTGNRTIGIGFNLERNNAREKIESLGLNFDNVYGGKQELSDKQVYLLFEEDIKNAEKDARKYVENFDSLHSDAQKVLIDMAFNLGYNRLCSFKKLKEELSNRNYQRAADEMVNSKWYYQVGNRSKELVNIIRSIKN